MTIHGIGISTLWCPSDGTISQVRLLPERRGWFYAYSSYAGNAGP
jgi:hypothetical protein